MLTDQIEILQEKEPPAAEVSGRSVIFYGRRKDGSLWGYDIEVLNNTFSKYGDDVDSSIKLRLISLMIDLQACRDLHGGDPSRWMDIYEGAGEDYLSHYTKLLEGLSEKALEVIAGHKKPAAGESPFRTGAIFARKLKNDREALGLENASSAPPFASSQAVLVSWEPPGLS